MAIVLARVDDRLLHGQVVVAWRQYLGFDAAYVVDDGVAGDPLVVETLRLAAPFDLAVRTLTVREAASVLAAPSMERIVLLFSEPQAALALLEAGISLNELNLGNLASGPGRKRVLRSISLSEAETAVLDALSARGVRVTLQQTPDERAVDWETVRRKVTW